MIFRIINKMATPNHMILTNFFSGTLRQIPTFRKGIKVRPDRINSAQANLYDNLKTACGLYIDGLISLDEQYIQSTSSPKLYSTIKAELAELKKETASPHKLMQQFPLIYSPK
jgi:hypothetical protein